LVAAILAGCGGSSSAKPKADSASPQAAEARTASETSVYAERAEGVCKTALRETRELGRILPQKLAQRTSPDPIAGNLVEPGIAILNRESSRLRDVGSPPPSRPLRIFLGLFDPIVELARQRVAVGAAGERSRAREIELLIADLVDEQSAAAQRFGFRACSIGFYHALRGAE
jgi:hypothetical protein